MGDYIVILSLGIIHIIYIAIYYGVLGNREFFGFLSIIIVFAAFPLFLLFIRRAINKISDKFKTSDDVGKFKKDV